jgi:hypothetical protein
MPQSGPCDYGRKIQTDTLPIWARSSAYRRRDRLLLRPRADPGTGCARQL